VGVGLTVRWNEQIYKERYISKRKFIQFKSTYSYNNKTTTTTMFKSIIAFTALASVAIASPMPAGSGVAGQLEKKDSKWGTGTWYTQNGNPGNCGWYKG
jgi:hypothetical protein